MKPDSRRRRILQWLSASTVLATLPQTSRAELIDRDLFDDPVHKLVYQFNKADPEYMEHVLFSVGAMLRKYGDDVHLVVTAIGPGLHILAKKPERPISNIIHQRVSSLAAYGVSFHACGNTMKALGWEKDDMLEFAEIVEIGADDLMLLQEQGYSYLSW